MAGRTDLEALVYQMSVDLAKLTSSSRQAERQVDSTANYIDRRLGQLPKKLARDWRALGRDMGDGLARGSQVAQVALAGVVGYSVKLAAEAQEIENAFDVAFAGAKDDVRAFSEQLAKTAGRDAVQLREAMSRLQLVITGTGVAADASAQMVKTLTERAVDVGSLFNVSDADALKAMISGLTGETEPLKRFGVVLNETAVKAKLVEMGFKGNAAQATEAQKAVARYAIILEKTTVAQGDAVRTQDSASNSAKRMQAEFNKAARELGEQLLPAATKAAGGVTKLLEAFNAMPSGVQMAGLAMLALVAAGGPIAQLTLALGNLMKLALATRAALAGTAAMGAGSRIGRYAAGGVVAGTAISMADLSGKVVGGFSDSAATERVFGRQSTALREEIGLMSATDADLQQVLDYLKRDRSDIDRTRKMALLEKEIKRRADAPGARAAFAAEKELAAAQAQLSGFEGLMDGAAAGGGSKRRGGGTRARFTGPLPDYIKAAVAAGRFTEASIREAYPDGAFPLPDFIAAGELEQVDPATTWSADEIGSPAPIVTNDDLRSAPDVAGSGQFLMSREDEERARQQWADVIGGGLRAAIHGGADGMAEYFASTLTEALINDLSYQLAGLLRQFAGGIGGRGGGEGGGGLFASIASIFGFNTGGGGSGSGGDRGLFGGGMSWVIPYGTDPRLPGSGFAGMFARGGVMGPGQYGYAGEGGRMERVDALAGGGVKITPLQSVAPRAASGGAGKLQVTVNLAGAAGNAEIAAIAERAAARGVTTGLRAYNKAQPGLAVDYQILGAARG